jgi:hypothetical protein
LVSKKFPVFNLMQLKPDWILVQSVDFLSNEDRRSSNKSRKLTPLRSRIPVRACAFLNSVLVPLQLTPPKHPRIQPGALRGCRGEAPLRLGGAQRGERRAPKGGLPP